MSKKEVEDLHDAPDADEVAAAVKEGLRSYNRSMRPDPSAAPVTLAVRGSDGEAVAGLVGHTGWGWLEIETLWVDESRRGAGLGRVLIARAEQIARERGCHSAHLDTLASGHQGSTSSWGTRLSACSSATPTSITSSIANG